MSRLVQQPPSNAFARNFYKKKKKFIQPIIAIMLLTARLFKMMGKVNQERLAEFLGELQRKENTNDRYVAALRGETLTRNPYVRIQPIPKQNADDSKTEKK
ncbi:hypothetical protein H6P81_007816 [Aristolochia fimbriata]|uniref:Uncharacterized protein n=1 Tax=Aristolochia fimbriata TaxID=158543 RepID=A0AAV7F1G1_ARIFI|nr:hypothetical protein H6P81_007816 [Aristolochia fimbriata]